MSDEIEVIVKPDGTTEIKVIRSKGDCHAITKPLEQALGAVVETKSIHNPGAQTGQQVKR